MKRRLGWRRVSRETLAAHLECADVTAAEAIGNCSVYRCESGRGESIAIALADGDGLVIEISPAANPALERRRAGGAKTPSR